MHPLADDLRDLLGARLRHLEQQLVVDREDHPRIGLRRERGVDLDHCALHDVGGRALNRQVDRDALRGESNLAVAAVQLGHQPPPPVHRLHDAGRARLLERPVDEGADAREPGEVGVDELLRRLLRHADVLRERERALAVEQRVVDHLGDAAKIVRVAAAVGAEDLQRRPLVEVGPLAERVDEHRIFRKVREDPELDLRIVRRDQHVPRIGDERAADLAPERRPDGDVLEVGIAAAQPPGGRDRLVEAGVHAAGLGVNELGQRVDVGAFQLHQPAPFEDLPRQIVGERKLFEHVDGGGRRARRARPFQDRQLQLVEQDFRELLR